VVAKYRRPCPTIISLRRPCPARRCQSLGAGRCVNATAHSLHDRPLGFPKKKTSNVSEKTSFPAVWLCSLPPCHLISKLQLISGTLVFRTLFAEWMTALA
jgi:hypothetical protein